MSLKQLRMKHSLTQEQLARAVGLSPTAISKLENGHFRPSFQTLKRLATFFNTSTDTIVAAISIPHDNKLETKKKGVKT